MRQLDLFGSLFDTPAQEKRLLEEIEREIDKKEELSAPQTVQEPRSIVELAEAAQGTNPVDAPNSIVANYIFDTAEVESENKTLSTEPSHVLPAEGDLLNIAQGQKKTKDAESEETGKGEVIFDNGKISVKVKKKAVIVQEVILEEALTPVESSSSVMEVSETVQEVKERDKKEPQKRGRKSLHEIEAEVDLIEVPEDEILFQKQYYPISEVAQWFRVNTSLIRFWENEFDILKPRKNRKGDRLFRPEDVKNLQLIYQLLRQRKYTIEGAKEYIKTNKKRADTEMQLTNSLQKFRSFLLDLKANL